MKEGTSQATANETQYVYIAKSPSLYAEVTDITFVKTRCDDASAIFKNTYEAVNPNQFTTVLPFVSDDIPDRNWKYLYRNGCIQPIVLEFDNCPMKIQEERAKLIAEKLQTPMFVVHSGNKSIHHYIYFAKFADGRGQYKRKCQQFLAYLAKEYPTYFKVKEREGEKHPLVPDYQMFTGNRYTRQANRANGTMAKSNSAKFFMMLEMEIETLDIAPFLSERESPSYQFRIPQKWRR